MTLPALPNFFHTLSVGLDYKHFDQTVQLGNRCVLLAGDVLSDCGELRVRRSRATSSPPQFNASLTTNIGTLSSTAADFDNKRFNASPSFTHFNADLSHTQELGEGLQLWGKVHGPGCRRAAGLIRTDQPWRPRHRAGLSRIRSAR